MISHAILSRICDDENDTMLNVKMYSKHGDLLSMQASWSKNNPGRRFLSFPRNHKCMFISKIFWRFQISLSFLIKVHFFVVF